MGSARMRKSGAFFVICFQDKLQEKQITAISHHKIQSTTYFLPLTPLHTPLSPQFDISPASVDSVHETHTRVPTYKHADTKQMSDILKKAEKHCGMNYACLCSLII